MRTPWGTPPRPPAWRCRTSSRRRSAWPALVRGFARSRTGDLGTFWTDMVRGTIRVLLPIAFVAGIVLIAFGVVQNFAGWHEVTTLAGGHQTLTGGPVASQEAIKELGTNGGGFYNVNSAHPFENPDPFTNLFEILLMLVIPVSLTRTFGKMVGNEKQGYAILAAMGVIGAGLVALMSWVEFAHPGSANQIAGAALEGKEQSLPDALRKLDPRVMIKSPAMFVALIGSVLTTVLAALSPRDWFG